MSSYGICSVSLCMSTHYCRCVEIKKEVCGFVRGLCCLTAAWSFLQLSDGKPLSGGAGDQPLNLSCSHTEIESKTQPDNPRISPCLKYGTQTGSEGIYSVSPNSSCKSSVSDDCRSELEELDKILSEFWRLFRAYVVLAVSGEVARVFSIVARVFWCRRTIYC